jgi:serine/threonine protein kinase
MIGRELAGYRIEAQIGQGGIGVVYRALDLELNKQVALKLLREDVVGPSQRPRFEREARALATLVHPNIVAILECGVSDSIPFLAMELLQGQTLAQAVSEGRFTVERARKVTIDLLSALAYVHGRGLVHRDLKPGNVFLERMPDGTERAKLLDFGLAKFMDPDADGGVNTLTRTGEVFGTPAYMPPEQWSGDKVDATADVYSAAVVCFELFAGRRPFMSEGQELLRAQLIETPPLLHEVCEDRVSRPELERALQKAFGKRARDRQPNAIELEKQLKAIPEPWVYEGRAATKERRKAARASRNQQHDSEAPTNLWSKQTAATSASFLGEVFHKLAMLGAWTLSILSLIVIGIAATVIYLAQDSDNPEALAALERALPKVQEAVSRGTSAAKDAVGLSSAPEPQQELGLVPDASVEDAPEAMTAVRAPRVPAKNPWKQPVPKELRPMRWKIEIGQEGDREMVKELRRYARKNNKDPRGPLLLARLYANRDFWNDAVSNYKVAYERDPSSRGDPRMLKDLVAAVARKETSWRASELIPVIYGTDALPEIKRVLGRTHDNEERLRLEQLAHTLAP